jgi:glycosyltransferase involved in cell wall biosynthesis
MPATDCLVLIPAFNEANNITGVLRGIRNLKMGLDILVINDGSTDNTPAAVEEAGERVINLCHNLGYGGALQTGFKFATSKGYQYVIQFDADGQHDPQDIPIILEQLRTGSADIVVGSRFLGKSFKIGFFKQMAIILFRFIIIISTGSKITDPTSGLQGLTKQVFSHFAITANYPEDFPDADTLISSMLLGFRVTEIPANIRVRSTGQSMHTGFRTVFYLLKMLISISVVLMRQERQKMQEQEGRNFNG